MSDEHPFAERRPESTWPTIAELRAALFYATFLGRKRSRVETLEQGALFVPVVGLAVGAAAAVIDVLLGSIGGAFRSMPWRAFFVVLFLEGVRGDSRPSSFFSFELGLRLAKMVALAFVSAGRVPALLFAPMLGDWAVVVCAFGARDATAAGTGRKFARGITFREFAAGSVFTFAVVMAINEALGVALLLCAAAITVALRLFWHRFRGGVTEARLHLVGEAVEVGALAVFAVLARG